MRHWLAIPALVVAAPGGASSLDQAIGLKVALDRPAGAYAIGDRIALTVSAARDVAVQIWLREPSGKLSPVIPAQAGGEPARVQAGQPARFPRTGGFRITPPAGAYAFMVTATTAGAGGRSLTDADSRLSGSAVREQRTVTFTVEQI